jgi:hypothetical protein
MNTFRANTVFEVLIPVKYGADVVCDKRISMMLKGKLYRSVGETNYAIWFRVWVVDRRI